MEKKRERPQEYPQAGVASTSRDFEEYIAMFDLKEDDLRKGRVLDVAAGGASFTAAMADRGLSSVAVDPFYAGDREAALSVAGNEIAVSSAKLAAMAEQYDWTFYGSPDGHRARRERSFARFAADFTAPGAGERYVAASLPGLPFADGTFSLVLCSHFLFLYGDNPAFDTAFHSAALKELLRVARPGGEVRIYPLVTLRWETYTDLDRVMDGIREEADVQVAESKLRFIPVGSPFLKLAKKL